MHKNKFLQMKDRRHFIKAISSIGLLAAIKPSFFTGSELFAASVDIQIGEVNNYIVDIHCHPTLKNYLWDQHIYSRGKGFPGPNMGNIQVTVQRLLKGNVKGIIATHHLPERGLGEDAKLLKRILPHLKRIAPTFGDSLEQGGSNNFRRINFMMDQIEYEIGVVNRRHGSEIIKVARSYAEFDAIIRSGKIAVAHAIEGAHGLGRDLHCPNDEEYFDNLCSLKRRGLCMITLAHFFKNDFAYPVEGINPDEKEKIRLRKAYNPVSDDQPLTALGERLVKQMLSMGIIVDLTHLTPKARQQILTLNENKKPIIFSHTGVQHLFNTRNGNYENYKWMGASDEEIDQIKACHGVIGIVFMNYWLKGFDKEIHDSSENYKESISNIIETIVYIKSRTGTYDNISIGSDFDGLADHAKDLNDPSDFPLLVNAIRQIKDIQEPEVQAILHGNAERVLRNGWS